jgi:hypothetical protein
VIIEETHMRATPLQVVKEHHGSKTALIDKIVGLVEPGPDESPDDHKRRLRNASNAKLLHLLRTGEQVKALGGRDAMVKKVLELKGQPKDHEYGDKLKKLSFGRLVDMIGSLERARKAKERAAKKQAEAAPKGKKKAAKKKAAKKT